MAPEHGTTVGDLLKRADIAMYAAKNGADSALVYRAEARRAGADEPVIAVMTSVYVADGDNWRLALYQQTPVAS